MFEALKNSGQLRRKQLSIGLVLACFAMLLSGEVQKSANLPEEYVSRYKDLIAEIRCPKCLNINIADSDAPIAQDLRKLVQDQLVAGKSDAEIKAYIQERYGDFALYNPPISPGTALLWALPLILIIIAGLLVIRLRSQRSSISLSDEERQQIASLRERSSS